MRVSEETFTNIKFEEQMLSRDGYADCEFIDCKFSDADLADVSFMDCIFKVCDFAMGRLDNVGFKDVEFIDCNFLGLDLSVCSPFLWKASFKNCQMDLIIAADMNLKGTKFENCSLKEADFSRANLTEASFEGCDLTRAIFEGTNLEKTDFGEAINYSFDPGKNILKKTIFSSSGVKGLLSGFDIIIK